eukprot:3255276-Pyramimonas_sp.AAC.1
MGVFLFPPSTPELLEISSNKTEWCWGRALGARTGFPHTCHRTTLTKPFGFPDALLGSGVRSRAAPPAPVSYTHLTLPTILLV